MAIFNDKKVCTRLDTRYTYFVYRFRPKSGLLFVGYLVRTKDLGGRRGGRSQRPFSSYRGNTAQHSCFLYNITKLSHVTGKGGRSRSVKKINPFCRVGFNVHCWETCRSDRLTSVRSLKSYCRLERSRLHASRCLCSN